MRWSVYCIVRKRGKAPEAIGLGYVNAPHQPKALENAWRRWPQHIDKHQVQAGFSVREYMKDHLSLGRK